MRGLAFRPSELGLSVIVALLLTLFIAYPIGAMLIESFRIRGPMPSERLRTISEEALSLLPVAQRDAALARWASSATPRERSEAMASAFALAGRQPDWNKKAAFDEQNRAIDQALAALSNEERRLVEDLYKIAVVMLHKRAALAFQVRKALSPAAFERLRSGTEERWGLDLYARALTEPFLRRALFNSLGIASLAALAATLLAFLLVFAIYRGGTRYPLLVRSIIYLPLVSPPVMIATATLMLFGRRGLVTSALLDRTLHLIDADQAGGYGLAAVIMAQALGFLPAAAIVIEGVLRQQDGRIEEAASSLGAGRARIFWHVTLPMALPGLKRALLLCFIMSLTDFGNPLVLGRDIPVAAGVIYDEITAFQNTPLAAAICVLLLLPCLILHLVLERLGRQKRHAGGAPGAPPELPLPLAWRLPLTILAALTAGTIILLYVTIAAGAFTRLWGVDWSPTLGYFTDQGVAAGLAGSGYGSSDRGLGLVWQSLEIALWAAPIGGGLGVLTAYIIERIRPPGRNALAFIALIPAILPGLIFGVGYVVAFNVPFGFKTLSLTGTGAILVLNILFAHLFVGLLAARSALQRSDQAVDEAASSLGASLIQRLLLVSLPMLRTTFLLGCLYVFVHGLTTLSSVIFLISGDHKLASVAIFNHASSGEFGYAAAKSLVILALSGIAMGFAWMIERRSGQKRFPQPTPGGRLA